MSANALRTNVMRANAVRTNVMRAPAGSHGDFEQAGDR